MQATDVLDKTPLDIFRDDFEVAKDKEIFNCWISNDLTNTLVVRHLRGYLVNMFSRSLGMNVVDASFKTFTNVKNNMINVKPEYNDDFLVSDFLDFEEQSEVSEIIRRELIQVLKTFSWFVHNVADNYNYEFDYEDKFLGYNCVFDSLIILTSSTKAFSMFLGSTSMVKSNSPKYGVVSISALGE